MRDRGDYTADLRSHRPPDRGASYIVRIIRSPPVIFEADGGRFVEHERSDELAGLGRAIRDEPSCKYRHQQMRLSVAQCRVRSPFKWTDIVLGIPQRVSMQTVLLRQRGGACR